MQLAMNNVCLGRNTGRVNYPDFSYLNESIIRAPKIL